MIKTWDRSILLICTLALAIQATQLVDCALAPYSETRSFRDALEGRSLEEAISGPVDKDTSSYGDRASSVPPPMMLNIPANGDLFSKNNDNTMRQPKPWDSEVEREKESEREDDSEREPLSPMMRQQRMLEQTYGQQAPKGLRQLMNGRFMKQMTNNMREYQQAPADRSYDSNNSYNSSTGITDSGFGDESPVSGEDHQGGNYANAKQSSPPKKLYASPMSPQNMIMSLANKAAYMAAQQKQLTQANRQMDSTTASMNSASYGQMGGMSRGDDSMSYTMSPMEMTTSLPMGQMVASRPKNRMEIRKMSPAMMNAMLNKMLNMKQKPEGMMQNYSPSPVMAMLPVEMLANMMTPQTVGSMSPSKREQYQRMMMAALQKKMQQSDDDSTLTTTMMPQAFGSYGDEQSRQQFDGNKSNGQQQQQQMSDNNRYAAPVMDERYTGQASGAKTMSPATMMMNVAKQQAANNYMANQMGSPDNYANRMMMMSQNGNDYQQRAINSNAATKGGYSSLNENLGNLQSATMNRYNSNDGSSDANMLQSPNSFESSGDSKGQQRAKAMLVMMKAMAKKMTGSKSYSSGAQLASPMNGFRQAFSQQQQDQDGKKSSTQYKNNEQLNENDESNSQGQSDSSMSENNRPSTMTYTKGYGQDEQQQQQQDAETKPNGDGYNSAPMGMAEPFAFDYKISDNYGNGQYRNEESNENGAVRGAYGYMDAGGIYRHVEYTADENGFRAKIKSNEPGLSTETVNRASMSTGQNSGSMVANRDGQRQSDQRRQAMMMPAQTE